MTCPPDPAPTPDVTPAPGATPPPPAHASDPAAANSPGTTPPAPSSPSETLTMINIPPGGSHYDRTHAIYETMKLIAGESPCKACQIEPPQRLPGEITFVSVHTPPNPSRRSAAQPDTNAPPTGSTTNSPNSAAQPPQQTSSPPHTPPATAEPHSTEPDNDSTSKPKRPHT